MLELALAAAFKATLSAPTHRPRVNHPWPITIRAMDPGGHPLRARLTMRLLYNGIAVGKVDNGRVYTFVGGWREKKGREGEYPTRSRGHGLPVQSLLPP